MDNKSLLKERILRDKHLNTTCAKGIQMMCIQLKENNSK